MSLMWQPVVEQVPPFLSSTSQILLAQTKYWSSLQCCFSWAKLWPRNVERKLEEEGKFKKKNIYPSQGVEKGLRANAEQAQLKCLFVCVSVCCVSENVCTCFNCRDRLTGNDAVGTTYLNLAKIASSGGEIEGTSISQLHDTENEVHSGYLIQSQELFYQT